MLTRNSQILDYERDVSAEIESHQKKMVVVDQASRL